MDLDPIGSNARLTVQKVKESYARDSHRDIWILEERCGRQSPVKSLTRSRDPGLKWTPNCATRTRNLGDNRIAGAILDDDVIVNVVLFLVVDQSPVYYLDGCLIRGDASVKRWRAGRRPTPHRGERNRGRLV